MTSTESKMPFIEFMASLFSKHFVCFILSIPILAFHTYSHLLTETKRAMHSVAKLV